MASLVTTTVNGNLNFETAGQYLTFYGGGETEHSISSRNSSGNAADDLRINTFGALFINLDSNNNNTSGADFSIGRHGQTGAITDWLLDLSGETGKLTLSKYGSGTHTGTLAKSLGVDSSGNVIEFTAGGGTVDGSGTANYLPLWSDSNTLTNSIISQSGTAYVQVNGGVRITGNHTDSGSQLNIWCDNSGHGRAAVYNWFFYTGGNNARNNLALYLGPTGSVGIGESSPDKLLHIKGTNTAGIVIENTTNATNMDIDWYNNGGSVAGRIRYGEGPGDFYFMPNQSTNAVVFKYDGKVGIGTATPYRNTHIYQAADSDNFEGALQTGGTSAALGGYFGYNSTSSGRLTISSLNNAGGANAKVYLGFGLDGDGSPAKEVMTLTQEGKVIIGGNAPTKTFEVKYASSSTNVTGEGLNGGGAGTGILIFNTQASNNVYANLDFRANNADGRIAYQYKTATNVGDFHFITDNTGSPVTKMLIANSGSIGAGTVEPGTQLDVNQTAGDNTYPLKVRGNIDNNGGFTGITFGYEGNTRSYEKARIMVEGTTGSVQPNMHFLLQSQANSTSATKGDSKLTILNGGSVGIGTNSPGSLLTVSGNSDDGDAACTIAINDEDGSVGSKIPAIQFYGGGTTQGRIRGGDAAFAIAVGSSPTTALSINTANGYPSFTYGSQVRLTLGSTGTAETNTANWIRSSGANLEFNAASGDFNWEVGGVHRMRLTDTGYLGIGLGAGTDPFGQLHVNGTNGSNIHITRTSGGTTSTFGSIIFGNTNIDSSCAEITGDQDGATDSGRLEFGTQASVVGGVVTRMTIKSDGNVGIGTATPGKRLEVIAAGNYDGIEIGSSSGHVRVIDFTRTPNSANPTARIQVMEPGSTHTSDMRFYTSDASGGAPSLQEQMIINPNGNVGIGTNSPETRLHVEGSSFGSAQVKIERSGAGQDEDPALTFSKSSSASDGQRLGGIYFGHSGTNYCMIRGEMSGSTGGRLYIVTGSQTNPLSNSAVETVTIEEGTITVDGAFRPRVDSSYTLGQTSLRWSNVYADAGAFGTENKSPVLALGRDAYMLVLQRTTGDTDGGTLTENTWVTRELNSTQTNTISSASLSSYMISLPSGTYYARFWAGGYRVQEHQAQLYNNTDSSVIFHGTNQDAPSGGTTFSTGEGVFTLSGTKSILLRHIVDATYSTDAGGRSLGQDNITNYSYNTYAGVEIWKTS